VTGSFNRRVLIVDDEPCFTELVAMNLDGYRNISVRCVNDPVKCVTIVKEWMPGLILLDHLMPEMCGDEIFRQLQADSELMHIPVIFLSATANAESLVQGPGVRHLPKPMSAESLMRAIDIYFPDTT
jgi:CheY-like chemotaxis protein